MKTIQLQSIGKVAAIEVIELVKGDVVIWNFGSKTEVLGFNEDKETNCFKVVVFKNEDTNGTHERRMKKDRLVGVDAATYSRANSGKPEEVKEDHFVQLDLDLIDTAEKYAKVQREMVNVCKNDLGIVHTATMDARDALEELHHCIERYTLMVNMNNNQMKNDFHKGAYKRLNDMVELMRGKFPSVETKEEGINEMESVKEIEFSKGDIVTFTAYSGEITAKVLEVLPEGYLFDNQVTYKLEGVSKPLITHCTGNSIKESKYYKTNKSDASPSKAVVPEIKEEEAAEEKQLVNPLNIGESVDAQDAPKDKRVKARIIATGEIVEIVRPRKTVVTVECVNREPEYNNFSGLKLPKRIMRWDKLELINGEIIETVRMVEFKVVNEIKLPRFTLQVDHLLQIRPDNLQKDGFCYGGGFISYSDLTLLKETIKREVRKKAKSFGSINKETNTTNKFNVKLVNIHTGFELHNESFECKKEANKYKRSIMKENDMVNHGGYFVNYHKELELLTNY